LIGLNDFLLDQSPFIVMFLSVVAEPGALLSKDQEVAKAFPMAVNKPA
jgi:hypothetical protein